MNHLQLFARLCLIGTVVGAGLNAARAQEAAPVNPLDPLAIPKYVTPLVIPPEMAPTSATGQPCSGANCPPAQYNIALRQFSQQVLPGGIFNKLTGRNDAFPPSTVWGYGRQEDPTPAVSPVPATVSSFHAPASTVEVKAGTATTVRWINELVAIDPATGKPYPAGSGKRSFVPPLTPVDPTMHWANPGKVVCESSVPGVAGAATTDCTPLASALPTDAQGNILPYNGPVPSIVHVHGAEDGPESDGYAEAWWLPQADNIPTGFATAGRQYDQANRSNNFPGSAFFNYPNVQPQTMLWYHDHTLGITHNNVYAGAAGFWHINNDPKSSVPLYADDVSPCKMPGKFSPFARPTNPALRYSSTSTCGGKVPLVTNAPGCDPNFDLACRAAIREIPLAIQDRSFTADGQLWYSASRTDASPIAPPLTSVPYAPKSDVAPIVNPEFFANTFIVNGNTYPVLQVAPQHYRFHVLNGSDARTLNLSLFALNAGQQIAAHALLVRADGVDGTLPNQAYAGGVYAGKLGPVTFPSGTELAWYQIASEQGYLRKVAKILTGRTLSLPGNPSYSEPPMPTCTPGSATVAPSNPADPLCQRALLIAPAQRPDVVVDFSKVAVGSVVRMINTAPDYPYHGFPLDPPVAGWTDQVMEFSVVARFTNALNPVGVLPPADPTVAPALLETDQYAEKPLTVPANLKVRNISLTELESQRLCAGQDALGNFNFIYDLGAVQPGPIGTLCDSLFPGQGIAAYGPRIDMLGSLASGTPVPNHWADPIFATPTQNEVQAWDIYNFTPDSHPMHIHGGRFLVSEREDLAATAAGTSAIPAVPLGTKTGPLPTEFGYTDEVTALPMQRTRVLMKFESTGLYQWHCHITEHEDNEMMLPLCVVKAGAAPTACAAPALSTKGSPVPPAVPISTAAQ